LKLDAYVSAIPGLMPSAVLSFESEQGDLVKKPRRERRNTENTQTNANLSLFRNQHNVLDLG
jgi:hypothetical protein